MINTPIAITAGDPSSISPYILLKAWLVLKNQPNLCFFTINSVDNLQKVAKHFNLNVKIKEISSVYEVHAYFSEALPVINLNLDVPSILGEKNLQHASFVVDSTKKIANLAIKKQIKAMVTNPVEKSLLYEAGTNFTSHTEFLATLTNTTYYAMMLCTPFSKLKVIPLTIHLSLKNAINTLTKDYIIDKCSFIHNNLLTYTEKQHKFIMTGLNPHCGENGLMGVEELSIIDTALKFLQKQGIDIVGPVAADTVFKKEIYEKYDIIIGMYHDQVLGPFKSLFFDEGVNTTLGLPFIRTSPDHGTAFAIADTKFANPKSLIAAIIKAYQLQNSIF